MARIEVLAGVDTSEIAAITLIDMILEGWSTETETSEGSEEDGWPIDREGRKDSEDYDWCTRS